MSTDRTVEIAKANNCEVIDFDTANEMDEQTLMGIRNNCWKETDAKWALVVDADELVDISLEFVENDDTGTIFQCDGYEVFGSMKNVVPSIGYCKPVLFRPKIYREINFGPGSHVANPITKHRVLSIIWGTTKVKLFHTKWLDWNYGIERQRQLAKRRSQHSKNMGWNFHYELDESIHRKYYEDGLRQCGISI